MEGMSRTRTAILITSLVIAWGINWPLTKMGLSYTPPILFAGIRTLFGGLLLLVVAIPRVKHLRLKQTWHIYLISCLFNIILFYGMQTVGLNYLPAGLFSVIVFLQPVLLGLLSWAWLGESMYGMKIIGLILGFAGVAVISGGSLSGHLSVVGLLLALGTAIAWAVGTAYVKKTGQLVDSIWLVTVQLIIGGLVMSGIGSGVESWSQIQWTTTFVLILLFIAVFVIAAGWLVFFLLIGTGEASKIASYTFLIPLISIFVGTLFLHEPFTLYLLAGLVLILVSIYFVNKPRKPMGPSNSKGSSDSKAQLPASE